VSAPEFERSLVLVKPDGYARGLVGEVIARFERRGLDMRGLKLMQLDAATAEKHYGEHRGKPFYNGLVKFITSGPLVAIVLEGKDCIRTVRSMVGATNCRDAEPGTIRGDFGMSNRLNLIHASDSPQSAEREMALFFNLDELVTGDVRPWIYDRSGTEAL
jgi:nucleoside-diphosphate kinase